MPGRPQATLSPSSLSIPTRQAGLRHQPHAHRVLPSPSPAWRDGPGTAGATCQHEAIWPRQHVWLSR